MRRAPKSPLARERGAALIMTLMIVAIMSIVAMGALERLSIAARRGANVAERDQAIWYLIGAEELARQTLRRSHVLDHFRTTLEQPWAVGAISFEIEDGRIEAELIERSNCFNLNSLARDLGRDGFPVNDAAIAQLAQLLRLLDFDGASAVSFANAAADWIDLDEAPRSGGAEDFDYVTAAPPYRAANWAFTEVDEARALAGWSEGMHRRARRFLCALPQTDAVRINVNTLRPEDAPVLAMIFGGQLSAREAREIIEDRPAGGWDELEEFWELPAFADMNVTEEMRGQTALRSSYFELEARVYYRGGYVEGRTLFRYETDGDAERVRRRFGADF